ncbi:MAG TPA: hypothetical protein PKE04_08515 [Clostridia bacterium]|nr:hypothetical protein [Clostridia bacterium]
MKKSLSWAVVLALLFTLSAGVSSRADDAKEPVSLNLITTLVSDDGAFFSTPVYEEFVRQSGIRLTSTYVDNTKMDLLIAGGDTTDLLCTSYSQYYRTMAESGTIIRLNDLIEQYGVNLKSEEKEVMYAILKGTYDDGADGVYGVINSIGMQGGNAKVTNHGYLINWAYYAELGYPQVKDFGDFLDVLEQIMKAHPTTDSGAPIYGIGFFNENGVTSFLGNFVCKGYRQYNSNIYTSYKDNALCYAFLDEEGPYWQAAKYYNDAWNRGIIDPDAFTQTSADHAAKMENGQYLNWWYGGGNEALEALPIEGTYMQENLFDIGANVIAIASTCSDPVAAIGLLEYLHGTQAGRLIYSGVEGLHWTAGEGGAVLTPETVALKKAGGDPWKATGVSNATLYSLVGVARGVPAADGANTDLFRTPAFFMAGLTDTDKAFIEHYGREDGTAYEYPNQVLYARGVKDGYELCSPITKSYGSAPEDIARLDATLLEIAVNAIPRLVMAAPGDYEGVKAQVQREFADAGIQESYAYWQGRWQELADQYLN